MFWTSSFGGTLPSEKVSTPLPISGSPFFSPPAPVYTVGSPLPQATCGGVHGVAVEPPAFGEQARLSPFRGSTPNAIASMLFVPTVPFAVGVGAVGGVVLPLAWPPLKRPPPPAQLTVPAVVVHVPLFPQSNGCVAAPSVSLIFPSCVPATGPCSMKPDGGAARVSSRATKNVVTAIISANSTSPPARQGCLRTFAYVLDMVETP